MEDFARIFKDFLPLSNVVKFSILDIWEGPGYVSEDVFFREWESKYCQSGAYTKCNMGCMYNINVIPQLHWIEAETQNKRLRHKQKIFVFTCDNKPTLQSHKYPKAKCTDTLILSHEVRSICPKINQQNFKELLAEKYVISFIDYHLMNRNTYSIRTLDKLRLRVLQKALQLPLQLSLRLRVTPKDFQLQFFAFACNNCHSFPFSFPPS